MTKSLYSALKSFPFAARLRRLLFRTATAVFLQLTIVGVTSLAAAPTRTAIEPKPQNWAPELHVQCTQLIDSQGRATWLQGVNIPSLEYTATGDHVREAIEVAIRDWKANAIRLPVKESYWYGREKGQHDGGAAYRALLDETVNRIANDGAYIILDLHRFGAVRPEHVQFWREAATHYRNHPAMLFDIFNEPHGISWEVWRNGGFVEERKKGADEDTFLTAEETARNRRGFESPGMQKLVDTIRSAGARNVIIAGGLDWAYDLSGVVNGYALEDHGGNGIMYSTHIYNWKRNWQGNIMGAVAKYPILVGEVGADVHKMSFIDPALQEDPYTWVPDMLGLIQKYRLNWTAWSFNPKTTPVLLKNWHFEPTPYWGVFAKRALAGQPFALKRLR